VAVYAIRNTRTGSVKIGFSEDPEDRLKTLQTAHEDDLELVATCQRGNLKIEGQLHEILDGWEERVRGEWFRGPVTNCMVSIINWMNTSLGVDALRTLLRRLDEDDRNVLAALLETPSSDHVEPVSLRIAHLLSDGSC